MGKCENTAFNLSNSGLASGLLRTTLVIISWWIGTVSAQTANLTNTQAIDIVDLNKGASASGLVSELPGVDNFNLSQAEELVAQGGRFVETDRYQDAQDAFANALLINRVNNGLFNLGQVVVIEHLLNVLLLQRKWPQFDQQLQHLDWLHHKVLASEPEQLAASLVKLSDWHRAAAAAIPDSISTWHVIRAKYLNWEVVSILEQLYGKQDIRLSPVLYRIVMDHHYQSISNQRRGMTSYDFKTDGKIIVKGWSLSKNESIRRSYNIGLENLQRIRAIYASSDQASATTDALMLIHIADWELLHGNNARAKRNYQISYQALLTAGESLHQVENYFDQAVVLPMMDLQVNWQEITPRENESLLSYTAWSNVYPGAQKPAELSMGTDGTLLPRFIKRARVQVNLGVINNDSADGNDFGYRVTGLNIVDYVPEEPDFFNRIFEEVSRLQFRPKIVAGEVTNHETVLMNYIFAN